MKYVHALWNEHLNSNGQQFHQYKQNEQVPQTTDHMTMSCHMTRDIDARAKCVVCVKV